MRIGDIILISANSLTERKFRFALNLIGILIGVAAVTGLISLTQGMNASISGELGAFGGNTITVLPGSFGPNRPHGPGQNNQVPVTLNWRDLEILEELPDIDLVAPTVTGGAAVYSVKSDLYTVSVKGVTENYFLINEGTVIEEGRSLIRSDVAVAVIGFNIAVPDPDDDPVYEVGDRIKLTAEVGRIEKELTVRIVGIIEESGSAFGSDSDFFIPLKTCEQFYETDGTYDSIQVYVENSNLVDAVAYNIEDEIEGVGALTAAGTLDLIDSITGTIEAVLGGVAAISLLVAGVGIINTMTVSVMERTKEIGVMKALGAKSVDILVLFMIEAGLTGVIGGIIGAGFGFLLGAFVGNYVGVTSEPSMILGVLSTGFAVLTSVISGLYPSWSASQLHPVEALRHE
ncbi:ABC transporter permease [Candidatus Bathyarchaeota archaeon]|jgi:putative ABC transport system permease protein|nr:ABC transporter permease [Candidatus Bathyarchaeota archaeon]MBT4319022.1 ABC transporter permease [Candidatus Bathyarchaeota archaeon]MBT4423312.1 ABC transporter permease [Candidatus Bathyarchaeota archaeon]MBT6604703.1 ABC transporter permease [Candidatus Bathyarchaeota archaeon]MBT7185831.1 ABC transporter permease [Candidatus Bathyarchaeota archaeon]